MAFSLFGIGKDHSGDTKNKVVELFQTGISHGRSLTKMQFVN